MSRIEDEVVYWCRKYGGSTLAQVIRGAMDWARSDEKKINESLRAELNKAQEQSIADTGEFARLGIAYKKLEAELASTRAHHQYDVARKDAALDECIDKLDLLPETWTVEGIEYAHDEAVKAVKSSTPAEVEAWAKDQEKLK